MLGKKIEKAFNEQINAELYSAYMYLSMAAWFDDQGLPGMSHWMRMQAKEEDIHGMKFFDFICERAGRVSLTAIETPPSEWKSPLDVFEAAYAHEQVVTGLINDLMDLAISEKDHASVTFLNWFVDEQVEEEATALDIVGQLKLGGDTKSVLFLLDRELGQRVAPNPQPQA